MVASFVFRDSISAMIGTSKFTGMPAVLCYRMVMNPTSFMILYWYNTLESREKSQLASFIPHEFLSYGTPERGDCTLRSPDLFMIHSLLSPHAALRPPLLYSLCVPLPLLLGWSVASATVLGRSHPAPPRPPSSTTISLCASPW